MLLVTVTWQFSAGQRGFPKHPPLKCSCSLEDPERTQHGLADCTGPTGGASPPRWEAGWSVLTVLERAGKLLSVPRGWGLKDECGFHGRGKLLKLEN